MISVVKFFLKLILDVLMDLVLFRMANCSSGICLYKTPTGACIIECVLILNASFYIYKNPS